MANDHVYRADDPQARRVDEVRVNGVPVRKAFYADTQRGVVKAYREPLKKHKHGKRYLTKTMRGHVEVTLRG